VAKAEENLILQSQTFDDSYWTKGGVTVTANNTTAPDGTSTADAIFETDITGQHTIYRNATLTSAATHVRSVYAKANGRTWISIYGATGRSYFDIQNGVTGTVEAGFTASIVNAGNGWYRCILVGQLGNPSYGALYNIADADNSISYAGDITKGVFLWGAQLEQRSSVTAYTATTTAPITNYIPALQTAASGVARFEHNPITGESLGLEIEEQRTNLAIQSEGISGGSWGKVACTFLANEVVAPDGTLTADVLVEDTTNNGHFASQVINVTSGTVYTFSAYVKAQGRSIVLLYSTQNFGFTFNLATGAVGSNIGTAPTSTSITNVGNGWYRCSITYTATTTGAIGFQVYSVSSGTTFVYTGNGWNSLAIWGAQLEAGSFATSYIPTTTAQVTRLADSAVMTGTNFSSWFRADEGTVYSEVNTLNPAASQNDGIITIKDSGADNCITINIGFTAGFTSGVIRINAVNDGAVTTSVSTAVGNHKTSIAYKVNDVAFTLDNSLIGTDSSVLLPVVDRMFIGANRIGAIAKAILIKKIAFYPKRLTNEELQGVTTI
jgi:hypothetical protein